MSKTSVARRNRSWRAVGATHLASNYNPREELKYPKFGNFLYQLGKMEWTGSTAHSIEHFGSIYRIQKEFVLDGIHVRTQFTGGHSSASKRAKSDPHRYSIKVFGETREFEDSPYNDSERVIKQFNQLGSLSMAFATRGTGSANATYCSGQKIINLTNKRGDGTFAHEWGHYLDNILTMLYNSSTSNSVGMASHLQNEKSRIEGVIINKAEDLKVQEVMTEIMTFFYKGEKGVTKGKKTSDYWANSAKMSSKYWTEPHELFARAWETYIFDKLERAGRSNNYLTSDNYFQKIRIRTGESICVYPEGLERVHSFDLFEKLISVIKTQYRLGSFVPFSNTRKDEFERFNEYNYETLKAALMALNLN
jgi:Large polyvalent protein-associated domain 1